MEWTHCTRALVSLAWGSPQMTIWPQQKGNSHVRYGGAAPRPSRASLFSLHPLISLRRNGTQLSIPQTSCQEAASDSLLSK